MPILPSTSPIKRATTIPSSFDRFRSHDDGKSVKHGSERLWIRKIQVHPNNTQSMEHNQNNHDASHLFHATNTSKPKIPSSSENSQDRKLSLTLFDTRPTSNVVRIHNTRHVSVCPPTPSMISYRQKSLPTLVPTRIINYPKPFNESMKQLDVDHLDI